MTNQTLQAIVAFTVLALIPIALLLWLPPILLLAGIVVLVAVLAFTGAGRQIGSVTGIGLSTIYKRIGASAIVVIGIGCVVGVLVGLLAIGAGFEKTLKQTGSDDTAIFLQAGAQSESASAISRDALGILSQAPQVPKTADGYPMVSAELLVGASMRRKSTGLDANLTVRGVGEQVWALRPQLKIVTGRKFQTGLQELMVGRSAHEQFADLDVGNQVSLNGKQWSIVGVFDSDDAHNSELWADSDVLGSAYRRGSGKTSLVVKLSDKRDLDALKAFIASDPRLRVDVQTTREYYSRQSEKLATTVRILGITIGSIMALGAIFGALNTMYSAVAARSQEIATLRALGFTSMPVMVSILLETMILAAAGGAIGAVVAWLLLDGYSAATMGSAGQIMFAFDVSPQLLWSGLKFALAIGLIGGLLPAMRAAQMPIPVALREL